MEPFEPRHLEMVPLKYDGVTVLVSRYTLDRTYDPRKVPATMDNADLATTWTLLSHCGCPLCWFNWLGAMEFEFDHYRETAGEGC